MISRLISARLKVEVNQVPYASVGVSIQNLIGGQVDVVVATWPPARA